MLLLMSMQNKDGQLAIEHLQKQIPIFNMQISAKNDPNQHPIYQTENFERLDVKQILVEKMIDASSKALFRYFSMDGYFYQLTIARYIRLQNQPVCVEELLFNHACVSKIQQYVRHNHYLERITFTACQVSATHVMSKRLKDRLLPDFNAKKFFQRQFV